MKGKHGRESTTAPLRAPRPLPRSLLDQRRGPRPCPRPRPAERCPWPCRGLAAGRTLAGETSAGARGSSANSPPSTRVSPCPISRSMSRRNTCSSPSQNDRAMPAAPARAVRPMRCTYVSGTFGRSKLMTCDTPVDVDPPRRDIGGHQHPQVPALEIVERPRARPLRLVAVDRRGPHAALLEELDHAVGPVLGPREHQRAGDRPALQQRQQQLRLVRLGDEVQPLVDLLDRSC
jgi:hypothetical protein